MLNIISGSALLLFLYGPTYELTPLGIVDTVFLVQDNGNLLLLVPSLQFYSCKDFVLCCCDVVENHLDQTRTMHIV